MIILLCAMLLSFLGLLLYYQKQDKIYIGYSTVLALLFVAILALSMVVLAVDAETSGSTLAVLMLLVVWILGGLIIYITSQLTLAFEKINQLAQHIAIREIQVPGDKKAGEGG